MATSREPDLPARERLTAVPCRADLVAYRGAVADIAEEVRIRGSRGVEDLLATRLSEPELLCVLAHVPGGADAVVASLVEDLRGFRPNPRSSARDLPALVRIYLLSQVDSVWWRGARTFETDLDVLYSTELVDLDPLRRRGLLRFQYRAQSQGIRRRAGDWLVRRLSPGRRPHTAGLRFTRGRWELIALLNDLARDVQEALPRQTPPFWVTSLVRSVEHQHHLRALGYAAVLPSSHCVGYGVDIEMRWFRRFDEDGALAALLIERHDAGELNVIDEGQAWHVCISPAACERLARAYPGALLDEDWFPAGPG
jgi:hypothetical protein